MNDTISRSAAIDAINKALDRETLLNSFVRKVAVDAVKAMPSAQPSATDTNVATTDTISRQAAIETVRKAQSIGQAHRMLVQLPSAQQVPWDRETRNSMAGTLQMLRRLAYNIHGVMDVIDDDNVEQLTKWLEGEEP